MEKIQLFASDGGHVTDVEVPKFQKPFEVLIWGTRFFVLKNGRYVEAAGVYHAASWSGGKTPIHNV